MTNETERAADAGVEERAAELVRTLERAVAHGHGPVVPQVLDVLVVELGITPEMVERIRHDLHTAADIEPLRVLLRAAGRSER